MSLARLACDLGSFSLGYLGQTSQITGRQLLPVTSNLATTWSYLPNSGDRRLASIGNVGLSTGQYSNYGFTTTPENLISAITESSDAATVYPAAATQTATYNNLNQLTNLSGQALTFDADGNVTSDGLRNYTWDAENRLVGITYPGQSGKATAFSYDGLSRRTAIASTPTGGGSTVTTSYLWCGARLCQAHNASNAITREYFAEGEFLPGSPSQTYYYGPDQIGSVRRVFASTSSATAYGYDPYGNALQPTTPLTDFNYAGMFFNADSGLYLTQYRAYDPLSGRWLSRDPAGEGGDPPENLYTYVTSNPLNRQDPTGLFAAGFSVELSAIFPTSGGGPGLFGYNFEYTSDAGWHLYKFATPKDCNPVGFNIGLSASANFALGNGSWTGPFNNIVGNYGPVAASAFYSPQGTGDWRGGSIGWSAGTPVGLGEAITNYSYAH